MARRRLPDDPGGHPGIHSRGSHARAPGGRTPRLRAGPDPGTPRRVRSGQGRDPGGPTTCPGRVRNRRWDRFCTGSTGGEVGQNGVTVVAWHRVDQLADSLPSAHQTIRSVSRALCRRDRQTRQAGTAHRDLERLISLVSRHGVESWRVASESSEIDRWSVGFAGVDDIGRLRSLQRQRPIGPGILAVDHDAGM